MKTIKVGLLGYGLSGRVFHGPLLKSVQGFEVIRILTRDAAKASEALSDFPLAQIVTDEAAIFEDPEVDLAVICTPNVQHFPLASKALMAGKHVVVEKPFTVTAEEAKTLIALAEERHLKLSVYQNRRFDGDFKTVQALLRAGTLGRLVSFESRFDRYRPALKENAWREKPLPGSGVLYDLGSHLIDQALCLFGKPEALYADLAAERNGEADDAFELKLYYPGLKVTLRAASLVKTPTPRFSLYGTEGAFVKYGLDPQEDALKSGGLPTDPDWGTEPIRAYGRLDLASGDQALPTAPGSYQDFYAGVYDAITRDLPPPVSGEDGLAVIAVIEAALKSHQLGQKAPFPSDDKK